MSLPSWDRCWRALCVWITVQSPKNCGSFAGPVGRVLCSDEFVWSSFLGCEFGDSFSRVKFLSGSRQVSQRDARVPLSLFVLLDESSQRSQHSIQKRASKGDIDSVVAGKDRTGIRFCCRSRFLFVTVWCWWINVLVFVSVLVAGSAPSRPLVCARTSVGICVILNKDSFTLYQMSFIIFWFSYSVVLYRI